MKMKYAILTLTVVAGLIGCAPPSENSEGPNDSTPGRPSEMPAQPTTNSAPVAPQTTNTNTNTNVTP